MPNNEGAGILEDFVSFLVPPDAAPLWKQAKNCVKKIPLEQRRFPASHHIKAEVYTWLAWQAEPGRPLGVAIRAKYLDAEALHARKLVAWLRQLFEL
jgi:hypothetical protein